MNDLELFQETETNTSISQWRSAVYPTQKTRPPANEQEKSETGRISARTEHNEYYEDVHTERDIYKLKDKKFRSLWLPTNMIKPAAAGKNGTYDYMFKYAPSIPYITTLEPRHYTHTQSTTMNDVEMLLDAEHAINAANYEKLSHGGIREIDPVGPMNPSVDNVVAPTGPDATDLSDMRGLEFQYNYVKRSVLNPTARRNFMRSQSGLKKPRDTTARPHSRVVP